MPRPKLTSKQQAFVQEYLVDLNATQAALRAGYSPKTADRIGTENLQKPVVSAEIERLKAIRAKKTEITAELVLRDLYAIRKMSVKDIMNDDFSLKPLSEWPDIWLETINGIDVKELFDSGTGDVNAILKKIKWPDKLKALEMIGRHVDIKAFTDNLNVNHNMSEDTVKSLKEVFAGARRKGISGG